MLNITDELKAKLLAAKSAEEVTELLKADGQEITPEDAAHLREEIERKRSRSQSALVQAVLLQETPEENDVEWFNKYTGEITACRNHMIELQKKLKSL